MLLRFLSNSLNSMYSHKETLTRKNKKVRTNLGEKNWLCHIIKPFSVILCMVSWAQWQTVWLQLFTVLQIYVSYNTNNTRSMGSIFLLWSTSVLCWNVHLRLFISLNLKDSKGIQALSFSIRSVQPRERFSVQPRLHLWIQLIKFGQVVLVCFFC